MTVAKTTVILLAPEALSAEPPLLLPLPAAGGAIRLLVRLSEPLPDHLHQALTASGLPIQYLAAPGVAPPDPGAFIAHMPPGTSAQDLDDYALALADALLARPEAATLPLLRRAAALGKIIIAPGDAPVAAPASDDPMRCLDPELPGWHAWGSPLFGRLEQAVLECLAFNWLGDKEGARHSYGQLHRCIRRAWRPGAYFAPEAGCRERNLDAAGVDPQAPIIASFAMLDRRAVYGAYMHRDMIWIMNFGAAFAVFAAVAGALSGSDLGWGLIELCALVVIGALVFALRHTWLQERWTACRLGAEQLRIARMCLPLFVVPPALASIDRGSTAGLGGHGKRDFGVWVIDQVKRAVREQGLPRLAAAHSPVAAARWLQLIVDDQTAYHNRNYRTLEQAEHRLTTFTNALFFAALIAVVAHFIFPEAHWLLLITAAGPAFAAASHVAGTRLGIVHRVALSRGIEQELRPIGEALVAFIARDTVSEESWYEVRRLAAQAADAMGRESTSWHSLVTRSADILP
jgi:hypothetical protein